ncbi:MAG: glycosyltransferase [Methanomicrobiaceae archaeon]|nr:glycosyltransferase [Methanomicrobiaceae archaeon]
MISVIIPTMNEEEHIGYCLSSLTSQTLPRERYEIIVVDGSSTDRTREIAEGTADRVVLQGRPGIGGARRDGVDAASGSLLVFTDADTLHRPEWLETIEENITICRYDVCTGPILFYEKTLRSELLAVWRKQYNLFHLFNFYWLIGSNMAMTREVYDKIDGHRDISILEDFDLSVRMFKEGDIKCRYDPRQEVYTSARRITNLFTYLLVYMYGHYHYHFTHDYVRLLKYPRFDEMDLRVMLEFTKIKEVNRKFSEIHTKFINRFERSDEGREGK